MNNKEAPDQFAIIGVLQWHVFYQQGIESRCRPFIYGRYHLTTQLDAVADVIAPFFVSEQISRFCYLCSA